MRGRAVQGLGKCSGTYPQLPSSSWITPLSGKQGKEGKCQPYCSVSHSKWVEDPTIIRRPGVLTICMDNKEIPGRIQMERFIPVKSYRKKKILWRYYLFPVLPEIIEIFCTICFDYQYQALCGEKVKILPVFCKLCYSIPFLFSVPIKILVPFDGNFSPKFPYKW